MAPGKGPGANVSLAIHGSATVPRHQYYTTGFDINRIIG